MNRIAGRRAGSINGRTATPSMPIGDAFAAPAGNDSSDAAANEWNARMRTCMRRAGCAACTCGVMPTS